MFVFGIFAVLTISTVYANDYTIDENGLNEFYYTKDGDESSPYKSPFNFLPMSPATIGPESRLIDLFHFPITPTTEPESEWINPPSTNPFPAFWKPTLFPFYPPHKPFPPHRPPIRPIPIYEKSTASNVTSNDVISGNRVSTEKSHILEIPLWIQGRLLIDNDDNNSNDNDNNDIDNNNKFGESTEFGDNIDFIVRQNEPVYHFTDEHGGDCTYERTNFNDGKTYFVITCEGNNNTFDHDDHNNNNNNHNTGIIGEEQSNSAEKRKKQNQDSKIDVTYYVDELFPIDDRTNPK